MIKLLMEKHIGRTLNDINQSKILYDPPPRVMEIKTKVNKYSDEKILVDICLEYNEKTDSSENTLESVFLQKREDVYTTPS